MGKYDSSIYRVRPFVEKVKENFQYLQQVLELLEISGLTEPQEYWYNGNNCSEKQLKPSKKHLEELIRYIAKKNFKNKDIKNEKRKNLCLKEPECRKATMQEAVHELTKGYASLKASSTAWYVFEGFTNPDIFIEGEDYVILCEGKWTESHITIQTTNLLTSDNEYRNQMIRHIQGALNYTDKKIYAFYIVDEKCGYLDDLTCDSLKKQIELETIKIDDCEKGKITDAFKGYITWQQIEKIIPNIDFKSKNEIDQIQRVILKQN